MMLGLDMAMVKHSARLPWSHREGASFARIDFTMPRVHSGIGELREFIDTAFPWHHWQFTSFWGSIISLMLVVRIGMIDAMEVNRMGKVMRIFEHNLYRVALFN